LRPARAPAACGDVEAFELLTDRLVLATPAAGGEGGGGEGTPIAIADIDPTRLLLLEDGHCLRDHALAACKVAEPPPDAPLVASTLDTLVRLVDAGLGVTLLPQMGVAAGILHGARVHSRPVLGDDAERRIALVWRAGHPRAEEFRLLGATIRDAVAAAPGAIAGRSPGD
jgi:LysR family hydrogen peroxide-inducible transcriptional activator